LLRVDLERVKVSGDVAGLNLRWRGRSSAIYALFLSIILLLRREQIESHLGPAHGMAIIVDETVLDRVGMIIKLLLQAVTLVV